MDPKSNRLFYLSLFLVLVWAAFLLTRLPATQPVAEVPYTTFKQLVADNKVTVVELRGSTATLTLTEPMSADDTGEPTTTARTHIPDLDDDALLPLLEAHDVTVDSRPDQDGWSGWMMALLPWVLLIGFYIWFQNRLYSRMTGGRLGGRDVGDFLGGSARQETTRTDKVTFDDVAGQDAAKQEVAELVSFLKDPDRYRDLGAEPPHGVLLMGPPGTGKTLMARALAGEADVPFFSVSASEFIEMFVGVGASRVRTMFEEAKKRAPSILFIDELDSVGRVRGTGLGGGHDEREQTLNQILSELDGFSGREAVIVLAATNRPDVLDPALLRPGRFDRHVTLELPDKDARRAILKVHTRRVPLDGDADLAAIAAGTPGFSGADLKNLVNEAAMAAAREGAAAVTMRHLDEMRDKVMLGTVRTLAIQPDERHRLAVHEAGHTAVAYHLPKADPLYKVTIIPRGRSLGSTHMLPEEERHTLPEDYLRDRLAVMLGGRTAEKEYLGTVSSGADDDIREATKLARAMVARWGMAEAIGPVDFRQSDDHPFLGREMAQPRRFSEATAHQVDKAVQSLLKEAAERAARVLRDNELAVHRLVDMLERNETLDEAQISTCLNGRARGATVVPLHTDTHTNPHSGAHPDKPPA